MSKSPYPWQDASWAQLLALARRARGSLLLYGPAEIGKVALARHLGASLLCETPDVVGHACGTCASCRWVAAGSHPDLVLIRPEVVQEAEGLESEAGAGGEDEESAGTEKKSKRAPSKEVRIEQIRVMSEALTVGSHRGGMRVVVLYPADALNQASGNALLKVLEEPPADTLFVLITSRVERLLPTVRSRCRQLAVPLPDAAQALAWLEHEGVKDAGALLAAAGGAPLAARAAAQSAGELAPLRRLLIEALSAPQSFSALRVAERLTGVEPVIVVGWLLRWVHDCISYRLAERIRYHPNDSPRVAAVVAHAAPQRLLGYQRQLLAQRRVAEHPLNKRLFLESLLLGYPEALQGY